MKSIDVFTGTRTQMVVLEERNFLYHARHRHMSPALSQEALIRQALDHPIGCPPLEAVPKDTAVAVLVDDATRPTPAAPIVRQIVQRLEPRTRNITFVTAPGTHRTLTRQELELKIGRELLGRYPVVNVDYKRKEDYRYIGDTDSGYPIHLHQAVLAADYKVAVGNIGPHNFAGWSGGAKILQPGVCGEVTTTKTHLEGALNYRLLEVYGNLDCKMRAEIDKIGERVGLDFIANTVLGPDKNILGLFCGHYLEAHRAGVAFAQQALRPEIPALADIVVVSAYPSNVDYWQGFKPLGFSMFGVKPGGTVIFLFDPVEGLCNNSPAHLATLQRYLRASRREILADLDKGLAEDIIGTTNPLYHQEALEYVGEVLVVTDGLTDEECRLLSFRRAHTVEEALARAFRSQGADARVGVIPFGGETLVRVAGSDR